MSTVIDDLAAKFLESELEILALHEKVDGLRDRQWSELVAMQQEQIRLLTELLGTRRPGC